MRESENIQQVAALLPDYLGFIFYKNSPRYVTENFVMPYIGTSSKKVAVFVNESTDRILEAVRRYQFDFVQLHGNESVSECEKLKQNEIKIIKAFPVHDHFDFQITKEYKPVADYFLFDTTGKHYGGNAKTFDWRLLEKCDQQVPFFLSGGLSIENISHAAALKGMNIHALDLNSGVEISPGFKSLSKIKNIQRTLEFSITHS